MSFLKNKLVRLQHLSDETISRLVSGELAVLPAFRAVRHMERCWHCRARREALDHAAMQVTEHRNRMAARTPGNPERRAALFDELRRRSQQADPQPASVPPILKAYELGRISMTPVLSSIAIVVAAAALLAFVWWKPVPVVSASTLLSKAEAFDAAVAHGEPGVIYQRVRITTARSSVEREIYRDARGKRRRRPEQAEANPVREVLASAHVDWDAPLSAASFRQWHDLQEPRTDVVSRDGNLLKLVTTSSNGWIQEQSLMVRLSDFHPVGRTIRTRPYGTIEIAELNYAVLGWNTANESLFEPLASFHAASPVPPAPLSADDLDLAELDARLALNRIHADEGEQINVVRTDRGIEVKGVAETDERMHQIVSSLRQVPHVRTDVLSLAELQGRHDSGPSPQSVSVQTLDVQASPLVRYLSSMGTFGRSVSDVSGSLLDASLAVRRNAAELAALEGSRAAEAASPAKSWVIGELSRSYFSRLLEALDAQEATLRQLGFKPPEAVAPPASAVELLPEAEREDALCRELIAGSDGGTRSGPEIAAEMFASIARIRSAAAAQLPAK